MINPKISVIVPVYNVEKYLSECLDSIVNQTLKDIEIICVNDASTDNSLQILREYSKRDARIKIIDKENQGQGYARKVGLDSARGEYILFCDSDDYYSELTAFEELYNYIEKVKVDVVLFNHFRENKVKGYVENRFDRYPKLEKFSYLDIDNIFSFHVGVWIKLYSKHFLDKYDDWYFPKKIKYEDMPFHFQILTRARISYIDKYLYTYRFRPKSTVTYPISQDRIFNLCDVFAEIYNITKNKCHFEQFLNYFYSNLFSRLSSYQIKEIEVAKYIIDTIKQFDISKLCECKNKDAIFLIKAGLRMTPENYMEYLNKKNLKIKNKEIVKLKSEKQIRDIRIKTLNEQLQQKNEQIKTKNEQLQQKNEQIKNKNEQIKAKNEQIKNKNEAIEKRNNWIKDRDLSIKQKNNEIQNLHNQTNIQDQVIKRLQTSWSYRIGRLFTYPLSIPLELYKFIRDYNLIKKSNLFDSEYYLANNEDVKNAKVDPIKHYLKFGWKEGRNPSAKFDGNEYLYKRPDVKVAGICPLVHYLKFGKEEDLSFLFEKINLLESQNNNLATENMNLEKKINEKSVEFDQLNRKKSELNIKLSESKKDFEKLNKRIADLENFKKNMLITYKEGINKDKISFEIEKFLEFSKSGITDENREPELIVSLTSYPARIHEVYYTIFSILIQTLKPNKIILWLGEDKFPNKDKDLPKNLLEFTKYGLTIEYTKDLKPHTKLIPALKEYSKSIIVTADDDIFYPNDWLEKLYDYWKNNKDCIICHRISIPEITKDKRFVPFNDWKESEDIMESSLKNFALGLGGVLYPPNCFYKDILNEELFMKLTPKNDDIWFWAMAVLNGTRRKKVDNYQMNKLWINPARERNITDEPCLWKINCVDSNNQNQIQLDNVINHYPQIMEKLLNE